MPVERPLLGAPLALEAVGAALAGGPAEVEGGEALLDRPLQRRPVEQHVHADGVVAAQRGGPGDLEGVAVREQEPGRGRLALHPHDDHLDRVGEGPGDGLEELDRVDRRAEVPHVLGEDAVEVRQQARPTPLHRGTLPLGPLHLGAELAAERLPELLGAAGQGPQHRHLVGAHGPVALERRRVAQLQVRDPEEVRDPAGLVQQLGGDHRGVGDDAPVIHVGDRDQVVAEEPAPQAHERQHAPHLPGGVLRVEVVGLVPEEVPDQPRPGRAVVDGRRRVTGDEGVPARLLAGREGADLYGGREQLGYGGVHALGNRKDAETLGMNGIALI